MISRLARQNGVGLRPLRPVFAAVVGLMLVAATSCHRAGWADRYSAEMMERTVPDGVPKPFVYRDPPASSYQAHWDFEVRSEVEPYREWLSARLAGFSQRPESQNEMAFVKTTEGDTLSLRIRLRPDGPKLQVHVNLVIVPF